SRFWRALPRSRHIRNFVQIPASSLRLTGAAHLRGQAFRASKSRQISTAFARFIRIFSLAPFAHKSTITTNDPETFRGLSLGRASLGGLAGARHARVAPPDCLDCCARRALDNEVAAISDHPVFCNQRT